MKVIHTHTQKGKIGFIKPKKKKDFHYRSPFKIGFINVILIKKMYLL